MRKQTCRKAPKMWQVDFGMETKKIWLLINNIVLRCDIARHSRRYSFTLLYCKSLARFLPAQSSAYPSHGIFSAYSPNIYILKLSLLWLPVGYSQKLNTKTDYLETSLRGGKKIKFLIIIQKHIKYIPTENWHTFKTGIFYFSIQKKNTSNTSTNWVNFATVLIPSP